MLHEECMGQHFLRGTPVFLLRVIQAFFGTEVRDIAFCGNSCTAKKNDGFAFVYDIFQFLGSKAAMNSPGRPLDALAEHQAVLDALAERDPQKAEAAMTEHMKNTEANTISHSERQN